MSQEKNKETSEEAIKYFDETQYRTAIVKSGEEISSGNAEEDRLSNLIALLCDAANKDFKEETLLTLKKEKAGDLLIDAIKKSDKEEYVHILVSACWESEINFSGNLAYFTELVMHPDYLVSIEAITVIENMEGPFDENDLKNSISQLKQYKTQLTNEQLVLINDLIDVLQGRMLIE